MQSRHLGYYIKNNFRAQSMYITLGAIYIKLGLTINPKVEAKMYFGEEVYT